MNNQNKFITVRMPGKSELFPTSVLTVRQYVDGAFLRKGEYVLTIGTAEGERNVVASGDGMVTMHVGPGQTLEAGQTLFTLNEEHAASESRDKTQHRAESNKATASRSAEPNDGEPKRYTFKNKHKVYEDSAKSAAGTTEAKESIWQLIFGIVGFIGAGVFIGVVCFALITLIPRWYGDLIRNFSKPVVKSTMAFGDSFSEAKEKGEEFSVKSCAPQDPKRLDISFWNSPETSRYMLTYKFCCSGQPRCEFPSLAQLYNGVFGDPQPGPEQIAKLKSQIKETLQQQLQTKKEKRKKNIVGSETFGLSGDEYTFDSRNSFVVAKTPTEAKEQTKVDIVAACSALGGPLILDSAAVTVDENSAVEANFCCKDDPQCGEFKLQKFNLAGEWLLLKGKDGIDDISCGSACIFTFSEQGRAYFKAPTFSLDGSWKKTAENRFRIDFTDKNYIAHLKMEAKDHYTLVGPWVVSKNGSPPKSWDSPMKRIK